MQWNDITIRTRLEAGDLGYIIFLHGKIYAEEYGYSLAFESYVAQGLHEFYQQYDTVRDAVWIAAHKGNTIGFLLLMHRGERTAQLRFFLLEKAYRGMGLGIYLMQQFMTRLRENGYTYAYLWTTNEQVSAAGLYTRFGFVLGEEKPSSAFGKPLVEQKYEWSYR